MVFNVINTITDGLFDFYFNPCYPKYYDSGYSSTVYSYDVKNWYESLNPNNYADLYPNYPVCDHCVYENGEHELKFAVTGFKKEEISVEINDDFLIIKGISKKEKVECKVIHKKIANRDFEITFKISDKLDINKICSKLEDGVLTINIPLNEEIKKRNRKIEIA